MNKDPFDYQILFQDALRGLVRRSLEIVADQGFTGEHHFYLAFRTGTPGVVMPSHLRESYPDEMTIVLKTQFKDLEVTEDEFSVGLFFSGVLYYLTVPFNALVAFTDPSVGFQLVFQPAEEGSQEAAVADGPEDSEAGEPGADNVVSFSGFRKN